jgi:tetratricopeptide (TPR) repeat protein
MPQQQADVARPEALNDRGVALAARGRIEEAIACYRHALAVRPDYALALNNLGLALQERGLLAEALAAHHRAVTLDPAYGDGHNGLAAALAKAGRIAEAVDHYRRALALDGNHVEALANLGLLLRHAGRLDEALALQRRAAALRPGDAEIVNNLGITFQERNEGSAAIECFRRAVALRPDHVSAHVNLAMALLAAGRLAEGSAEYEWRWRGYRDARLPALAVPLWDGRPLGDGTLLLWAEQGFGDTIQFVRYAPLLRAHARRVLLACPPALVGLMRGASGLDEVIPWDAPLPAIDGYVPLLGLLHRLGTTLETIPGAAPYLAAAPERVAALAPLLAGGRPRIGLVWRGNPRHPNDRRRSLPLPLLQPLLSLRGARFFSLQPGFAAAELAVPAMAGRILDLSPALGDFADTAAVLEELDLVVTVDTAVAHLAGALGRPCWLLLPFSAEWRWLAQREDSPWYPSLRLFRQERPGDWPAVIARLAQALAQRFGLALRD